MEHYIDVSQKHWLLRNLTDIFYHKMYSKNYHKRNNPTVLKRT